MSDLPEDHESNFPAEWWNERRKRDYFVTSDGLVKVRPGSPTDLKVRAELARMAMDCALLMSEPRFLQ